MAAYAAVVSLMNTMEQMQNHPFHSFSFDKEQIECLYTNLGFLLDFLETYSHGSGREAEALESQIVSAAYETEDVIESHIVDQILAGSTFHGKTSTCFLVDLQKIIETMDFVKKMVLKVKAERGLKDQMSTYSTPAASSRPLTVGKNVMVGFDDELIHLMDVLTRQQSSRQIISIIGMGGMGKSTLAKNVYDNTLIVQHFDIRMWAMISQEYCTKKILLELLSCQGKSTGEIDSKPEDALGEQLYKNLSGRRYLIILDDIWSIDVWDNIKAFFPDNRNGSRIVVTSRQSDVANHFGSSCLAMDFLDEAKSWNLFCQKAFSEQCCPPELEETGKQIVKKCKGLPLLIVLIGGHLGKSSRTEGYWKNVAKDMTSILASGEDEQCIDILSLSYSYLPAHLKPCFLYTGIFPEDHEISVSTLIKLWVAEGFLKPSSNQTLEEVAENCLQDLVDRNLILVRKWRWNGKIKTCNIHDLLRELCLKVADKQKFFCTLKSLDTPQPMNKERRLVIHGGIPLEKQHPAVIRAMKSAPLARSLICKEGLMSFDYRLLKVLKQVVGATDMVDGRFLELKLQQVNLRYLHCKIFQFFRPRMRGPNLCLPSSISMLWNLQTLIIKQYPHFIAAPSEIWKMPQLRHVDVRIMDLPDPPPSDQQNDFLALQNLQTLLDVRNFRMSEDVCERIPNIKKLYVGYDDVLRDTSEASSYYSPHNLGRFQKLESLRCYFPDAEPRWRYFVLRLTFPISLQKLYLNGCFLHWKDLTRIGSLPHLEVLILDYKSVGGSQWNPAEGEFLRLKFLRINACNKLIYWNAERSHFPVLEKLVLERLKVLSEIPSGIGEIPTLQFIRLEYCSVSVAISAMRIVVEQEIVGNDGLQLEVEFWDKEELERFEEMVQAEGLSSNNLRLDCYKKTSVF